MTPVLRLSSCSVRLDEALVWHDDGRKVQLTENEVGLLRRLARTRGEIVSRAELLEDVWGYHPDVVSRAVDSTVKRLRRKIEANPAEPRHLQSVYGQGYRLDVSERPAADASLDAVFSDLREHTSFIGRRAETAALFELVERGTRLVTIKGPGGAGKTRLGRRLLTRHREQGLPALFVDLAAVRDAAGVCEAVGLALGLDRRPEESEHEFVERLGRGLVRHGGLLLLDNLEQVADIAAGLLGRWLRGEGRVQVVGTSRIALRMPGEEVLELGPMNADDAADLFVARAASAGHRGLAASDAGVRAVVQRLEGLPLAVELAAARTALLDPESLLEQLRDPLRALAGARTSGPARHATLHDSIAWSWALLDDEARHALIALAAYAEAPDVGWFLESLGPGGLDAVQRLRDQSMVHLAPGPPVRVGMLEVVRAFVEQVPVSDAVRAQVLAAHRDGVLAAAGDDPDENVAWSWAGLHGLRRVRRDLERIVERDLGRHPDAVASAILKVERLMELDSPAARRLEILERGLGQGGLSTDLEARLRLRRVEVLRRRREVDRARRELEQARALLQDLDEPELDVAAEMILARFLLHDDPPGASLAMARARAGAEALLDDRLLGSVHLLQGHVAEAALDPAGSEAAFRRAVHSFRQAGEIGGEATARYNVAYLALQAGRHDEAESVISEAIRLLEQAGDERSEIMRGLLPLIALDRGQADQAVALARRATRYGIENDLPTFQAEDQYVLGNALHLSGELDQALDSYGRAIALHASAGRTPDAGAALAFRSLVHLERGDRGAAARDAADAREALEELGVVYIEALLQVLDTLLAGGTDLSPLRSASQDFLSARFALAAASRVLEG